MSAVPPARRSKPAESQVRAGRSPGECYDVLTASCLPIQRELGFAVYCGLRWPIMQARRRELPYVYGFEGWRSGLAVDDTDLEHRLDILLAQIPAHATFEQIQIMRTGGEIGGGLGAIAADAGDRHDQAAGGGVVEASDQGV